MAQPAASTDDFDPFSERYDELLNQSVQFSGGDAGYFADYKVDCVLRDERGRRVTALLDLGCGVGNATARFAEALPEAQCEGVDVSADSIRRAQARHLPRARFQAYDGGRLPFGNEAFDVCFIAVVMHHVALAAREPLLREVLRTLKPGGRLYIFEHNPYNPLTRKVVNECPFDENAILLRPGECRQLVSRSGFEQARVHFRLFVPPHPLLRWLLPIEDALEWLPIGGQYYVRAHKPL